MKPDKTEAVARAYAAGRMLAGLEQIPLAEAAGVSPASISNVERGHTTRPSTRKKIRRALSQQFGVNITSKNGVAAASIVYEERETDE